jgi:Anti-sigma-K factor rskA
MMDHLSEDIKEKLAAYALGSLDLRDMVEVESLLASSPLAREELRDLREVVGYLPYAAPAVEPPDRVRRELFARIAASQEPQQPRALPRPMAPPRRAGFAVPAALALLTALVLILGGMTLSLRGSVGSLARTNRELSEGLSAIQRSLDESQAAQAALLADSQAAQAAQTELLSELASSRQELSGLNERLAVLDRQINQDQYVLTFVTAPGVATRELAAVSAASARGEMYMYPGQRDAVVLFRGLPALEPGKVYQFWLADGQNQVAGGLVEVDASGLARLIVEAPREVNAFSQVMLTVEQAGGSSTPSQDVVLEGSL